MQEHVAKRNQSNCPPELKQIDPQDTAHRCDRQPENQHLQRKFAQQMFQFGNRLWTQIIANTEQNKKHTRLPSTFPKYPKGQKGNVFLERENSKCFVSTQVDWDYFRQSH